MNFWSSSFWAAWHWVSNYWHGGGFVPPPVHPKPAKFLFAQSRTATLYATPRTSQLYAEPR
jgi:hypothetical protein